MTTEMQKNPQRDAKSLKIKTQNFHKPAAYDPKLAQ